MARIARLEEYVATARLQGGLVTIPAQTSTMTHVAELGGGLRGPVETGRSPERATERTTEPGRPLEIARSAGEGERPSGASRTVETGRTFETARPVETSASRTAAMAGARPSESNRPSIERSRTVETRRTPDGSPRRDDPQYRRSDDTDPTVYRATEDRRSNGASYGWLWALPLAALAGLGLYFLRPTEHAPVTASREPVVQTVHDTAATVPDLKAPVLAAIQTLSNAVHGITDRNTATAALPKIQDAAKDVDRLAMQSVQLPDEARTALANAARDPLAKLNTAFDTAGNLPGVGPLLQPAIANLRGRMDAIAMVPGKPLFFASAPSEWVTLSSVYNRDVVNRAGERMGTASGFFIAPDGKVVASLVSVDRQLGIGDKQIAMPFSSGQLVRRDDGWHLVVDTTKDDMQRAKAFELR
jgi:hypothetical protein